MRNFNLLHFVHTSDFDASAEEVPLGDEELLDIQSTLQENPEAGSSIPGTGGVRKLRAAVKGKGKRGGARILYYFVNSQGTIYLLLAYDKSVSDDISEAGKKVLRRLAKQLEAESN